MPAILDVAIGTVFIFLLFSIVVTALNEIWLSLLDKRAAFLKEGLEVLLDGNANISLDKFLGHGLISSLSRATFDPNTVKRGFLVQMLIGILPGWLCEKLGWSLGTRGVPSYIPGKSFVLALLSFVESGGDDSWLRNDFKQQLEDLKDSAIRKRLAIFLTSGDSTAARLTLKAEVNTLRDVLASPLPADPAAATLETEKRKAMQEDAALLLALLKSVPDLCAKIGTFTKGKLPGSLLALYKDAGGDLDKFKANIENWFNQSMDRVGGWYKRYAQQWLFSLALILAIACNVDGVRIIRALSVDKDLRASIVEQAQQYVQEHPAEAAAEAAANGNKGTLPNPAKTASPSAAETIETFKSNLADLGGTGIPMGWTDPASTSGLFQKPAASARNRIPKPEGKLPLGSHLAAAPGAWLSALCGWLLTALAASLGAPFWFDILNRFVDLRGVGRAPEEKDPTAPKKKITGDESYLEKTTP